MFGLVLSMGCATLDAPAHERYRTGSLLHAFGAPLVVGGAGATIAAVAVGVIEADDGATSTPGPAVAGVTAAVSLVAGIILLATGGAYFADTSTAAGAPEIAAPPRDEPPPEDPMHIPGLDG